jgi:3-hydroxymyristoyl/3-hydroxydecanoyl-(acyl carrier protein) dehydratase
MTFEAFRMIPADHPSLRGHFPGAPLVPGVVILDEVVSALREWQKDCRITGFRTVKFRRPLHPEQLFTISFTADGTRIRFWCRIENDPISEGQLDVCCGTKVTP